MRIRLHRATIEESLATTQVIDHTEEALMAFINAELSSYGVTVKREQVSITPYGYDDRNDWNTHLVHIDGYGVFGMTDGRLASCMDQQEVEKELGNRMEEMLKGLPEEQAKKVLLELCSMVTLSLFGFDVIHEAQRVCSKAFTNRTTFQPLNNGRAVLISENGYNVIEEERTHDGRHVVKLREEKLKDLDENYGVYVDAVKAPRERGVPRRPGKGRGRNYG